MDSAAPEQILIGVLANAVTALVEAPFQDEPPRVPAVEVAAERASARLCEVEAIRDEVGGARLRAFLASPEMAQFARQIFALGANPRLAQPRPNGESLEDIERVFVRSMQLWTGLPDSSAQLHGGRLFRAFIAVCDETLADLISKGRVDALDARATLSAKNILAELTNLKHLIAVQRQDSILDLEAILHFASRYQAQAVASHTEVAPPSLDTHHTRHVNEIYVKPRFVTPRGKKLQYDDLLPLGKHTVILGTPGSGKSTVISKLVADISDTDPERTQIPLVIVLRNYAAEKERSACSLIDYLAIAATSKYQIERQSVPSHAFEFLLRSRRAVVFLDGLDELLGVGDRREVVEDVEAFRRLYPTVPMVVTSRSVGYQEAPLQESEFRHFTLDDLTEAQVAEYAELALRAHSGADADEQRELKDAFLEKSRSLADLRGNPLLLGLLLERYVKTRNLPAHRVEVIESCALMLFERWDTDRQIPVRFPFESKLKPAVADIAFDIYSDAALQEGVTEDWLIEHTKSYLIGRKYNDPNEAAEEAREFIGLCRGRTWVFSARSADQFGTEKYAFTHRTFMEYFVAVHIVHHTETARELAEVLLPRVCSQEWDEVCQMAIYLGSGREGSGDSLLQLLLPQSVELSISADRNRLTFCARTLSILVPDRLATMHELLEIWIEALVVDVDEFFAGIVSALVNAHPENQETASRALPDLIRARVSAGPKSESLIWLIEVGLFLGSVLSENSSEESHAAWFSAERRLAKEGWGLICDLGAEDRVAVASAAVACDVMSVSEYLQRHIPGTLFVMRSPALTDGRAFVEQVGMKPLAERMLAAACRPTRPASFHAQKQEWALRNLAEFGQWALMEVPRHGGRLERPWNPPPGEGAERVGILSWLEEPERQALISTWNPHQVFGAACLAFSIAEQGRVNRPASALPPDPPMEEAALVDLLRPFLVSRDSAGHPASKLADVLLKPEQRRVLGLWAGREMSFTRY